jgi:hypothetical protein
MQTRPLKEIKLKLPGDLVDTTTAKEIVTLLLDKALSKAEYYRSKCKEFEEKYQLSFEEFKRKVEKDKKESFSDWDELMVWEGNELARQEWRKKYEELKKCRE